MPLRLELFNNDTNNFESYKDLIMFYQTTIRNVAITTAVAFAALITALGYSRFYRGKSKIYAIGMVVVSLCILIASGIINFFLYKSVIDYSKEIKINTMSELLIVNYLFMLSHFITMFFVIYTCYRFYSNNMLE
jgi:hypothetical protein